MKRILLSLATIIVAAFTMVAVKPRAVVAIPDGDGTKEKPYSVTQLTALTPDSAYVWVEGYVVGFVPSSVWANATFGNTDATGGDNFKNGTNVVLSTSPVGEATLENSAPIGLKAGAIRDVLGIGKNPEIYGARVKVCGQNIKYFGVSSLKNSNEYEIVEGGSGGGGETPDPDPDPDPAVGDDIYSGLSEDAAEIDWTLNSDVTGDVANVWSWKAYNSKYYLNGSAYVSGVANTSESYAVSPVISLAGVKGATLSFDQAAKFQTTLQQLCYPVIREEGATKWTKLEVPTWCPAGAWTWANSGNIDISAFDGLKVQIGFHYGSSAEGADTWEVKNVKITKSNNAAVENINTENAPVEYFNLQGVRVANPQNGLYIIRQGQKVSKVVIR